MSLQAPKDRFKAAELRSYLLADFTSDEPERGERELVERVEYALMGSADEVLERRLQRVASELVDEYAWDELTHDERRRFESNFLQAPERRRELSFALSFAPELERQLAERDAARTPVAESEAAGKEAGKILVFRRPAWMAGPGWSAAVAAALVVAVLGGVWSLAGKLRLEKRLDQALSTQVALAESEEATRERLAAGEEEATRIARELEAERLKSASLERELEAARTAREGLADGLRSTLAVASAWLTPGMLRGGGELERLIVPAEAGLVELMLDIGIDDYSSYRAVLRDAESDEIWSQAKLDAAELDSRVVVQVTLPASLLPVGDYSLHLSGRVGEGDYELLGRYYFRVLLD